jgi:lysophospholipase L1-like esterase
METVFPRAGQHWVSAWTTSPQGPFHSHARRLLGVGGTENVTVRQIVRVTLGGNKVRVRFTNRYGDGALEIDRAHVALSKTGAANVAGTDQTLFFNGNSSITIPAGETAISDPADLAVAPFDCLGITTYFPAAFSGTGHVLALQTAYISPHGDYCSAETLPVASTITSSIALSTVEVLTTENSGAVLVFGDCTADGANTTVGTYHRWLDVLAERMIGSGRRLAVLNSGLVGNRLLHAGPPPYGVFGDPGLRRFETDALPLGGVRYVIIAMGGADIIQPGCIAPPCQEVGAQEVIAGLKCLIHRSLALDLKVLGATIGPFEGAAPPGFQNTYSLEKEARRQEVNQWIRHSGEFDGILDFDAILKDPHRTTHLADEYDAGDHVHLNDVGHRVMGESIDLAMFQCALDPRSVAAGDTRRY